MADLGKLGLYRQKQKRLDKHNVSSTCRHNMVNLGPLTAEIGWRVWSTPANFNGFRILASLMHRRCSMEVTQTLHDVLAAPAMVHYLYIFGGFCSLNGISHARCKIHFASKSSVLLYWQRYCTVFAQQHSTEGAT